MIMIILLHSAFSANGWPDTLNSQNIILSFVESFSIVAVNVFVLISGYFSLQIKKKSLLNLGFIILFYGILRLIYLLISNKFYITSIFIFTNQNWFILSYIGLILISPILNAYVEKVKRNAFLYEILALLTLESISDFIPGIGGIFNRGGSVLAFANLYLIGRFISKYGSILSARCGLFYLLSSLVIFLGACCILILKLPQTAIFHWFYNSNPIIIFSSICFFLIFVKQQPYVNRTINYIAKSCLAVLLLHVPYNAPLWEPMAKYYHEIIQLDNCSAVILLWIAGVLIIYIISLLVDQVRLALWKLIVRFLLPPTHVK